MRALAAVVVLLALGACAPAPRAPLTSLSALGNDEVVLVGKIELVPALRKGEQKIRGMVVGNFENTVYLMMDEKLRPLPQDPRIADYAGRIEAKFGSTFFVRSKAAPAYLLGGVLFLEIGGQSQEKIYFPGGFQVAARPGDRAVYVGTLRYQRDEFFEFQRITVVDEYKEASAEFQSKFGGGQTLRRALLTRVKQP
jgi:hypothetical protein